MIVTELSEEYFDAVCELERECFSHPWTPGQLAETAGNGHSVILVAVSDQCVAGYGALDAVAGTGYFLNIAVSSRFRRRGIGTALVSSLCERAKTLGCFEATLEVRSENDKAIALYTRCGFKPVGRRRGYYSYPTDDAIIMTKTF